MVIQLVSGSDHFEYRVILINSGWFRSDHFEYGAIFGQVVILTSVPFSVYAKNVSIIIAN